MGTLDDCSRMQTLRNVDRDLSTLDVDTVTSKYTVVDTTKLADTDPRHK